MGMRLPRISIPPKARLVALAALLLVGAAIVVGYRHMESPTRGVSAAEERTAGEVGSWLAGALAADLRRLEAAIAHESIAELLAAGERGAVVAAEQRLAGVDPDLQRVWILGKGHDKTDYTADPPLNHASISLLRRAEAQGRNPPPEYQFVGSEQQQVAVVMRVEGKEGLLGHVLFSLNPKRIQRLLDEMPWPGGSAEVQQLVPGASPVVLATRGKATAVRPVTRDIAGTNWRLAYRPPRKAAPEEPSGIASFALWAGLGLGSLLAAGAGFWYLQRRRRAALVETLPAEEAVAQPLSRAPAETGGIPEEPLPLPTVEDYRGSSRKEPRAR